jgi:hypothetical protein
MRHLLRHPLLAGVTYILETPGMDEGYDAINIDRARRLAAGLPLDALPPGAMHLRGSRSRTPPGPEPEAEPEPVAGAEGVQTTRAGPRRGPGADGRPGSARAPRR